ncbi:MAG: hypothetical protein JW915_21530 [Chitinispirillaceae bacterium]|nr:hypothetical protein [Chitinispirillaceae bacterium]
MLKVILIVISLTVSTSYATLLPFPSPHPKVSHSYDTILKKTWEGIKKRNIDPYTIKAVHRPKSELPDDFVSEGIGYGMILALYCNDQEYFNKIWDAGEQYLWGENFYNWRANVSGDVAAVNGGGAATDAEEDIACMLIFADQLVKKNVWQPHTSPKGVTYAQRAQIILNSMWELMIDKGVYLSPGAGWGGEGFVNPGYFAPAFYRVFDEFDSENHNWQGLIDQCYLTIAKSQGYAKGLLPDWMKPTGEFAGGSLGYNSYASGEFMYKDAIRIYWRLAADYLWYNEPRAKTFCKNAITFLGGAENANFFQMDGSAVTDTFRLSNGVLRNRTEHSHLTIGMWACAAMVAGGKDSAEAFSEEILKFYENGDYWGKASDPDNEDTLHNEMYFDQFLAWFGASVLSGVFTNIWDDFKDPDPLLVLAFENDPKIAPFDINADIEPLRIKASFNKSARWNVSIVNMEKDTISLGYSGSGKQIDIAWYGTGNEETIMPQGYYIVTVSAKGLDTTYSKKVWLGKVKSIKIDNMICIDDFSDGDLKPYIGNDWRNYLDSYEGKSGKSKVEKFAVENTDGTQELHWSVMLDGSSVLGYNPYAALEWNCSDDNGNPGFSAIDSIFLVMGAASDTKVSVQLVTSDISDFNFFEDSLTLTSTVKEHRLAIKDFKTRWGGGSPSPDLSKLTAIRFQIQDVDNTQKELIMKKILMHGNLGQIYTDPPEYVKPPEPEQSVRFLTKKNGPFFNIIIKNGILTADLSMVYSGSAFTLFNCAGRVAFKGSLDKSGHVSVSLSGLKHGVYILKVQNRNRSDAAFVNWYHK